MTFWADLIKKHPILSFILITFFLTYIVWAIVPLASVKNPTYQVLITIIGTYGIAISAIIVSRILNPKKTEINPLKQWGVFIILFCLILPFALFNPYLKVNISDSVAILLCAIISALSAFVLSSVLSRNMGTRELMVSVTKWKIHPIWYAVALFLPPIMNIISNIINILYTGQSLSLYTTTILAIDPLTVLIMFISTLLVTTAVAEEPGWRSFLLPKLQSRYSPLIASIIVFFIWEP